MLADVWFYWEFHWTKGIPIKPTEDLVSFYCGVILAVFQGLNLEIFEKRQHIFSVVVLKVVESWQKRRRWGKTIISNELFNSHAAVKNCSSVRQESSILWFMIWSLSWKSKAHQAYEHNKTTIEVNRLSMNFQSHQLFDS